MHYEQTLFQSETPDFKDEFAFQIRLYNILESAPFNHFCYLDQTRKEYRNLGLKTFKMRNTKSRIDLYVKTSEYWPYHDIFPAVGIEVKMAKQMGYIFDSQSQVEKYSKKLPNAEYVIKGERTITPRIFLLVTPESFYEGHVYKWEPPNNLPKKIQHNESCWITITEIVDRQLQKVGASVLREKYFITNNWGPDNTKKWEQKFELWT